RDARQRGRLSLRRSSAGTAGNRLLRHLIPGRRAPDMAIDFELPADLRDLQARIRAFIAGEIVPLERDPRCSPHVAREYGGLALSHVGRAVAFEEAGYSPLGPVALNVAAPDEGNMHLLEAVATPAQKERWLRPLATAAIRSCFCMTEPAPGSGSDP